jgi:hypothetical protein
MGSHHTDFLFVLHSLCWGIAGSSHIDAGVVQWMTGAFWNCRSCSRLGYRAVVFSSGQLPPLPLRGFRDQFHPPLGAMSHVLGQLLVV